MELEERLRVVFESSRDISVDGTGIAVSRDGFPERNEKERIAFPAWIGPFHRPSIIGRPDHMPSGLRVFQAIEINAQDDVLASGAYCLSYVSGHPCSHFGTLTANNRL